jgi:hypothetical protein
MLKTTPSATLGSRLARAEPWRGRGITGLAEADKERTEAPREKEPAARAVSADEVQGAARMLRVTSKRKGRRNTSRNALFRF